MDKSPHSVGGGRLVVGGWWLVVGGWWLVVGGRPEFLTNYQPPTTNHQWLYALARSTLRAVGGEPAILSRLNRCLFGAITGAPWTQFVMSRVFQAIAPVKTMLAHDSQRLTSLRREMAAATGRNAAKIHSQPGFMHRGSGRLRAVNSASGAAPAVMGTAVYRLLLRVRTEGAVNARPNAAPAHFAHGRVEPDASVIIKRFDTIAIQRIRTSIGFAWYEVY